MKKVLSLVMAMATAVMFFATAIPTIDVEFVAADSIMAKDYDINTDTKIDILDVILMKQMILEDVPNDKNFKAVHLVRLLQYILGISELEDDPAPPVQTIEPTGSRIVEEMNKADIELIPEFFDPETTAMMYSEVMNGIHIITKIKPDGLKEEIKFKEQFGIPNDEKLINISYIGDVEDKLFMFYEKEDGTFSCAWATSIGRLVAKENKIDLTNVKQSYGTNELIQLVCDWKLIEQNVNDNIIETKFKGPMDHIVTVIIEAADKIGNEDQMAGIILVMNNPQQYLLYWNKDGQYYGYLMDID